MYHRENGLAKPKGISYTKAAIASDDLYGRIAASKETQASAQSILLKYGYDQAKTETDLAHKLASVVMNVGEMALADIAAIHPDKELILSFYKPQLPAAKEETIVIKKEEAPMSADGHHHHDCGCGGHHNAHGRMHYDTGSAFAAAPAPIEKIDYNSYMKPALLLAVSALLVVVVWKKI